MHGDNEGDETCHCQGPEVEVEQGAVAVEYVVDGRGCRAVDEDGYAC